MDKFKQGQIVYVSDDYERWTVTHLTRHKQGDNYPYKTCSNKQKSLLGYETNSHKHCLSIQEYEALTKE